MYVCKAWNDTFVGIYARYLTILTYSHIRNN